MLNNIRLAVWTFYYSGFRSQTSTFSKSLSVVWKIIKKLETLPSLPPRMESRSWSNAARPEAGNIKCTAHEIILRQCLLTADINNLTLSLIANVIFKSVDEMAALSSVFLQYYLDPKYILKKTCYICFLECNRKRDSTVEFWFLEPPRETKISLKIW